MEENNQSQDKLRKMVLIIFILLVVLIIIASSVYQKKYNKPFIKNINITNCENETWFEPIIFNLSQSSSINYNRTYYCYGEEYQFKTGDEKIFLEYKNKGKCDKFEIKNESWNYENEITKGKIGYGQRKIIGKEICTTEEVDRIDSCESEKCIDGYTREEKECDDGWKDTYCRVNKSDINKEWLDNNCECSEICPNKNLIKRNTNQKCVERTNEIEKIQWFNQEFFSCIKYKCFNKYTVEV